MLGRSKSKRGATSSPKLKEGTVIEIQTPSPSKAKRRKHSSDATLIIKTEKSNSNLDSVISSRSCLPSSRFEIENVTSKPFPKRERTQPKRKRQQKKNTSTYTRAKTLRSQKAESSKKPHCVDAKESPNEVIFKKEIDTFGVDDSEELDSNSGDIPLCQSPLKYQFPSDIRVKEEKIDYSQEIIDLTEEDVDEVPVQDPNPDSLRLAISLCQKLSKCESDCERLRFFKSIIKKYKEKDVSTSLNELISTKTSKADAENSMNFDNGCYNSANIPENRQNYLLQDSPNYLYSPVKKIDSCHVLLDGLEGSFKSCPDSSVSSCKEMTETPAIPVIPSGAQLKSMEVSVASSTNLKKGYYSQKKSSVRKRGRKRVTSEVSQPSTSSDSCLEHPEVSFPYEILADTTSEQNLFTDANSLSGQAISNEESQISLNLKTCIEKKKRSCKDKNMNVQSSAINASISEFTVNANIGEDSSSMLEELKSNNNDLELGFVSLSSESPCISSADIKAENHLFCYGNDSSSKNNYPSTEECNDVLTVYSNDSEIEDQRQKEVHGSFVEEMDKLEKLIHETSNSESECSLSTPSSNKIKICDSKNKTNCTKEDSENVCVTSKSVQLLNKTVETYCKSDASNRNSCMKDEKDPAKKSSLGHNTKMPKEAKYKKTKGIKSDKNISKSNNKNQDSLAPPEVNENDNSEIPYGTSSFMEVGKILQVKSIGSKSDQIISVVNDKFYDEKSEALQQSQGKESKRGKNISKKKPHSTNLKKKMDKGNSNGTDYPKSQPSHSCSNPKNVNGNSKNLNVSSVITAQVEYEQEKCKPLSHIVNEKTLPKAKTFKVSNEKKDSKNNSLPLEDIAIEQMNSNEAVGNENNIDLVTMDVTKNVKEGKNNADTVSESARDDIKFLNVLEGNENSIENKKKGDLVTKVEITKKKNEKNITNSTSELVKCVTNVSNASEGRINLIEKEKKKSLITKVESVERKEEKNNSGISSEHGKILKHLPIGSECTKNFIANEKKNGLTSKVEITKNREERKTSNTSSESLKEVENVSNSLEATTNFVENEKITDQLTKVETTKKKEEKSKPETSLESMKIDATFSNILDSKISFPLENEITNLSNSICFSNPLENPGAEPLDFNEDDLDIRDESNRKKKEPLPTISKQLISTDGNEFKKKIETGPSKEVIISKKDTPKPIEKYIIPKKGTKLDDKDSESRINQQNETNKISLKDYKKSGEYSNGGDLQESWSIKPMSSIGSSVPHKNDLLNKSSETFYDNKNINNTSTKVDHSKKRNFIPEVKDYNDPPKTLEESKEYLKNLYGDLKSLCTEEANKNGALNSLKMKYKADIEKQNATWRNQFFQNTKGSNMFDLETTKDNTPHLLLKPMSHSKNDSLHYTQNFLSDSISKVLNNEPETQVSQCIRDNTSTNIAKFQGRNDVGGSEMDKIDVGLPVKKNWFFKEKDNFIRKNVITNLLNKCPLKGNMKRSYRDKLGLIRDIVFLNEETFSEIGVIFWNESDIKSCFEQENFGGPIKVADVTIPMRDELNVEPRFSDDEELSICASETSVNNEGILIQCHSSDEKSAYELDDEVNYDELEKSLKKDSINNPLYIEHHSSPLKNIPPVLNDDNETPGPQFMEEISEKNVDLNSQIITSYNEAVKLLIRPYCKEFVLKNKCIKTYCHYKHKVPANWVNTVSPVRTWEVIENVLLSHSLIIPHDWLILIINWLQENGEINHILKICVFLGKTSISNYCEDYCSLWALIVSSFNKLGLTYRVALKLILDLLVSSSLSKESICCVLKNIKIASYEKENVWSIVQCLQHLKDFYCPRDLFEKLLSEATEINKFNQDCLNFLFNQIMQRNSDSLNNTQSNHLLNVIHLLEVNGFHRQKENIIDKLKKCNIYVRDRTKPNDSFKNQKSSIDANQSKITLNPPKNSSNNEMYQVKENSDFDSFCKINDVKTEKPDNSNRRSSVININEVYENTSALPCRFPNNNCSSSHNYLAGSLENHSVGNSVKTFSNPRSNYGVEKATAAIRRNLSVKDYKAVLRVLEESLQHNFVFDVARNCYLAICDTSPFDIFKELLETFIQSSHENIYLMNLLASMGLTIALQYVRVSNWKTAHLVLKLLEPVARKIALYKILDGEYSQLRVGITICEIYFNNMELRRACSFLIENNLLGKNQSKWSLRGSIEEFYLIEATINLLFLEIITKEKFCIGHSLFVAIFRNQKNLNTPIDLKQYYEKLLLGIGIHKKTLELYEMAEPKDKCLLSIPTYRVLVVVARRLGNKILRRELFEKCSTFYTIYPTGNKNTIKMYSKWTTEEMMLMIEEWFDNFKQLLLDSFYTQTNTNITIKIEKTPILNDSIVPKLLLVDSSIEGAMQRLLDIPSKFDWQLPLKQIDEDKAQIPAHFAEIYVQQQEKDLC